MAKTFQQSIETLFWPEGYAGDMWMIADGARDSRIYSMLMRLYIQHSCLYAGDLPHALERTAPYLVQLEFEDRYTRQFLEEAWGNSWGVFLRSNETMERLRRHFRQFLRVQDWRGRYLIFRYYDPRVLRVYLPTCNREELRTVFGPVKSFYIEDENAANLLECSNDGGELRVKKTPLDG